jgi:glucokinase
LTRVFGRVDVEHVVSGPGLVNIYQFTHQTFGPGPTTTPHSIAPARLCGAVGTNRHDHDLPRRIYEAGHEGRCAECAEALEMFLSAYGSETGNLALRALATAGVYVGGGIAPKILASLKAGPFLDAFRAKAPLADLIATIPVSVVVNPDSGLLGAAVHAAELSQP